MKASSLLFILLLSLSALAQPSSISPDGGGEFIISKHEKCLSDGERSLMLKKLKRDISDLKIPQDFSRNTSAATPLFDWPIKKDASLPYNSCYGISKYVDQDPTTDSMDYYCGYRSYDGHRGTDIFTWPFPWYLYENNLVQVVAAADGIIVNKTDGNDDDHCSCFGSWNAVFVMHADSSIAWYGHLKKNSLTSKSVGQAVSSGEYLGIVASSGCSTGPHLHFEVYDSLLNLIDPYYDSCNIINNSSWWAAQKSYREPTLNAIATHDTIPTHGCPGVSEDPRFSNNFAPGDTIRFAIYFHDQLQGDFSQLRVKRPNNSVLYSWSHTSPNTYNASWWYWNVVIPSGQAFGLWSFEIDYYGQTYTHYFNYGIAVGTKPLEKSSKMAVVPNPAVGGEFQLLNVSTDNALLRIFDATGRVVYNSLLRDNFVKLNHLSPGFYFLSLNSGNSIHNSSIIIR